MADKKNIEVSDEYLRKLEQKVDILRSLVDMTSIISSTLDLNDLMDIVMEKAKHEMDAEACSILFYNKQTNKLEFEVALCDSQCATETLKKKITLEMGQGIAGWVALNRQPLFIDDVKSDTRFFAEADKQTGFTTKSIVAAPLIGRGGLIGVAELINPRRKDYDPELFNILCRQFAIAIENAQLHRESIEKEKLKQELEIASSLQKSFLPASPIFKKGGLSASAFNIPASKIGGDLYDFIDLPENKAGFLIGDVSGKGISGALYMAKIISDFRAVGYQDLLPENTFNTLNAMLSQAPMGMFLTAIYIIADSLKGSARIAVAGHPPLLLITDKEVKVMDMLSGPPIGILPVEYPATDIDLNKGDRLLLYTDGIYDIKNKSGDRLGFENFMDIVRKYAGDDNMLRRILEYADDFSSNAEKADDITMMEIAWQ
jgi:sigma-B regulation protein RsbU (phosphoserine phosphatase)